MERIEAPRVALGQPKSVRLRQLAVVAGYLLVVKFRWRVEGGTGVGQIFADALDRFLQRVEIRAAGQTKQQYTGQTLAAMGRIFAHQTTWGGRWTHVPPTSLADGTDQPDRVGRYFLPLQMPWSYTPEEYALPTAIVQDPQLVVALGNPSDLVTGEDGTPIIEDLDAELYEIPYLSIDRRPDEYLALEIQQTTADVLQSSSAYQIKLPVGGMQEIRAVLVEAFAGGSAGSDYVYSDAVVEEARLSINGIDVFGRVPASEIRERNRQVYRLPEAETGILVFDAAEDLRTNAGELWAVSPRVEPYLDLKVNKAPGDCQLRVTVIGVRRGG